jgi:putative redox protein
MPNLEETSRATVRLLDGMAFSGQVGDHAIVVDATPVAGGPGRGPKPIDLLLVALAGCTAMDVIGILRKMHQEVVDYRVLVEGTRAERHPKIFTKIKVEHVVTGNAISPRAVERAVSLSRDQYCSVGAMLAGATQITHTWRISAANPPQEQVA